MTSPSLDEKHDIPEKSFGVDEKHDIPEKSFGVDVKPSSASVLSDDSTIAPLPEDSSFIPGSTMYISSKGIGPWRFPTPSSELEIPIYHNDGSLAYTSTRAKKSSGSAILSHTKLGELVGTNYFFGVNREPVMHLLQAVGSADDAANTINIKGKWTSRSTSFTTGDGRVFSWSYAHTKDAQGKRINLVVLRHIEHDLVESKNSSKGGRILAQLIRGDQTRSPGTKSWTAGNGGQLVLSEDATSWLDEAIIVATCLMMLKKEIDRRRMVQIMLITAAVSGAA